MKREIRIFFTALMFYTRIPCPKWVDHSEEYINLSTRYFPAVGWIVGAIVFLIFKLSHLIFPIEVSVILSMIAGVFVTGAFHEDGFADVCDGFGGGWTKEKILLIMKDSRLGTYGVVGLIFIFLIKFYVLGELASGSFYLFACVIIAAHSVSRLSAVIIIFTSWYARENDGKANPLAKKISVRTFGVAITLGAIPMILLSYINVYFVIATVPVVLITAYLRRYFVKWIDGYTGDCLGATQQINEVAFYLSCLAICNYI
jgi:adenosylcobinamide-GDP ribazoletransferase